MRNNRRRTQRHSVFLNVSIKFVGVLALLLLVVMTHMMLVAKCSSLQEKIGAMVRERKNLDREVAREQQVWEDMNAPAALEATLNSVGLAMRPPRSNQIVRMSADGVPAMAQPSLERLERCRSGHLAMNRQAEGTQRRRR